MHLSTPVFCADLRLEFGGKTIEGLWAASLKQWDTRPPELLFQSEQGPDAGWNNRLSEQGPDAGWNNRLSEQGPDAG